MPATTRPPGESHGCRLADSTFHSASRRCSGRPTMSPSMSETSTAAIASGSRRRSVDSEGEAAIGYLHAGEQARAARDDVVTAEGDVLAEHRAADDLAAVADAHAGADDAVAQDAARADPRALQDDGPLDDRARADGDVLAEHGEAADVGALGDARAGADDRRGDRAAADLRGRVDVEVARRQLLADSRADVALEDVERRLQVALGRADVDPVGVVVDEAVEAVVDEPGPDLALDRDVLVGRDAIEHRAL